MSDEKPEMSDIEKQQARQVEEKFEKYNQYGQTQEEIKQEEKETEKVFLTVSILGAIVGFIIPLIMWGIKKDNFSPYAKKYLTDVLNFELFMLILLVILAFVPIFSYLLHTVLFIFNLIVVIRNFPASQEEKPYSFPINVKFIQ